AQRGRTTLDWQRSTTMMGVRRSSRGCRGGGVMPGRRLRIEEREDIAYLVGQRMGVREIAARLRRSPATVSRELRRGMSVSPRRYRPFQAQMLAAGRARLSRPCKLAPGSPLRAEVAALLAEGWSPGQIAGRLKRDHPGRPELQVSHETIYQALYVQGKGSLRAEVGTAVRCGRARRRRPRSRAATGWGKIPGMINISQRPAEAGDRAVPGHWESQCRCQAA
ncbi:MAG TPA: IS30 family transposase, partial [Streptosporangiaceae bacterium]